ncbi:MAG TPA: hypothetical protein VMT03_18875 [Polyangia bacterium]|nr:hypothetical protein [Polyangia bacterium]
MSCCPWSACLVAALAAGACAPSRAICPPDTTVARHVYSGGGDAEWCRSLDGLRQGPESRAYENGVESVSGSYVDGAQSGVWRYRFNDGHNWRAERWDDGALIETTVDPAVARMSPAQLAAAGPTTSGVIKLASHDPLRAVDATGAPAAHQVVRTWPSGRVRAAGPVDGEGLRTGVWRFWFEDGKPAREIEFAGGIRDRSARAWYPSGAPAADGFYVEGVRDGTWRFWDSRGQSLASVTYRDGDLISRAAAPAGMLPASP